MITLDAIRTAMLSGDPYTEMDRLVQNELSAGRTTRQITNDFRPLIDEALETPGLTENGEESLLGVLDALTGDCHPDCHYKDPPNTTLPTEEEIAELPRWARVAFAARCARRVEILFPVYWLEAPHEARQTVQVAVELAEGAAANRHADSAHRESMLEAAIISIDAAEVVSLSEASVHAASSLTLPTAESCPFW